MSEDCGSRRFPPVCVSRSFLEVEIALSQDQIGKYADKIMLYSNTCMKELRRLFLVQDLVDSLKVGSSLQPPRPEPPPRGLRAYSHFQGHLADASIRK